MMRWIWVVVMLGCGGAAGEETGSVESGLSYQWVRYFDDDAPGQTSNWTPFPSNCVSQAGGHATCMNGLQDPADNQYGNPDGNITGTFSDELVLNKGESAKYETKVAAEQSPPSNYQFITSVQGIRIYVTNWMWNKTAGLPDELLTICGGRLNHWSCLDYTFGGTEPFPSTASSPYLATDPATGQAWAKNIIVGDVVESDDIQLKVMHPQTARANWAIGTAWIVVDYQASR